MLKNEAVVAFSETRIGRNLGNGLLPSSAAAFRKGGVPWLSWQSSLARRARRSPFNERRYFSVENFQNARYLLAVDCLHGTQDASFPFLKDHSSGCPRESVPLLGSSVIGLPTPYTFMYQTVLALRER